MKITRREFTKKLGGLGLAAALVGCGQGDGGGGGDQAGRQGETRPGFRRLGKTGLELSVVGFGAQRTRDPDLIRYALDQGMNHIETAWGYGAGLPGNSCECIGKATKGKRDAVILSVAYSAGVPSDSKGALPIQFEQTLRDLGTDHIDVFLWHHPEINSDDREWTLEENQAVVTSGPDVDQMLKWKQEGKFRWCGITMHDQQEAWLKLVADSPLYDVAVVAFNYKSPKRVIRAVEEAAGRGVGLIAMKTQSPSYLGGEKLGDAPDHRKALEWVLSKNYVTAAIPGMTTRDQADLNLSVMRMV